MPFRERGMALLFVSVNAIKLLLYKPPTLHYSGRPIEFKYINAGLQMDNIYVVIVLGNQ